MPSPFPGMDPYLEGAEWTSFHAGLIHELQRQLAPLLRPRYTVFTEKQFSLTDADDVSIAKAEIRPDVSVAASSALFSQSGSATIAPTLAPLRLRTTMPKQTPQYRILIREVGTRELVTVIELLSPSNKRGRGRKEYIEKRDALLLSSVHLLEIDLHRKGARVPMDEPLPDAPYFALLGRASRRPDTEVYPIYLDQPLPTIPVPLLDEDPDVRVNLQTAFNAFYELVGYDGVIDYSRPPEVPLVGTDAVWAADRIKAWKERVPASDNRSGAV